MVDQQDIKSNYAKIQCILNQKDNQLPFGYFSPQSDGKVTWNCGEDQNGKITSVFCYNPGNGPAERKVSYLFSLKEAIDTRDQLIEAGWEQLKPPEITVSYANGEKKPLSRQQKRYLSKQIDKMSKDNPYKDEK